MTTIAQLFGHNPKVYYPEKKLIPESGVDPTLLYGVELEIEGLDVEEEDRRMRVVPGMVYHEDGSLRNYGGEYVTAPMTFGVLEYTLNQFFHKNNLTEDNYSERCSVHVHANCCDLTLDQIRLLLCLYQITERILFNFIKADRKNNIFCVPWSESIIGGKALGSEEALLTIIRRNGWMKYTALNLLPLKTQGTIEFRHMEGTKDLVYIMNWCNIIGSLFKYVRQNKYQDVIDTLMRLNTTSAYATFMQSIFQGELYDLLTGGDFRSALEEGVLNMKFMLAQEQKEEKKPDLAWLFAEVNPEVLVNPYQAYLDDLERNRNHPDNQSEVVQQAYNNAIEQQQRLVNQWNLENNRPINPIGGEVFNFRWNAFEAAQPQNPQAPEVGPVPLAGNLVNQLRQAADRQNIARPVRPPVRRPINRNPR